MLVRSQTSFLFRERFEAIHFFQNLEACSNTFLICFVFEKDYAPLR
jgi:hypothetical protein